MGVSSPSRGCAGRRGPGRRQAGLNYGPGRSAAASAESTTKTGGGLASGPGSTPSSSQVGRTYPSRLGRERNERAGGEMPNVQRARVLSGVRSGRHGRPGRGLAFVVGSLAHARDHGDRAFNDARALVVRRSSPSASAPGVDYAARPCREVTSRGLRMASPVAGARASSR